MKRWPLFIVVILLTPIFLATVLLLSSGVVAQRRGEPPLAQNFSTLLVKAGDGTKVELDHRATWWRVTITLTNQDVDSTTVEVHETLANEWTEIKYYKMTALAGILDQWFYGPEIDSVGVTNTDSVWCRIDYWW